MPFSNAYGNALAAFQFNGVAIPATYTGTNLYLGLHLADPGVAGTQATSEISYTGYLRMPLVRNTTGQWTVSGKVIQNAISVTFPAMTGGVGGTVTHMSVGELASGAGTILYSGPLSTPLVVAVAGQPYFPANSITITLN